MAFLTSDDVESYFGMLTFGWEHLTNGLAAAQVHIKEIVAKLKEVKLADQHKNEFESALPWFNALNNEEKVQLFRIAFEANTVASVTADNVSTWGS